MILLVATLLAEADDEYRVETNSEVAHGINRCVSHDENHVSKVVPGTLQDNGKNSSIAGPVETQRAGTAIAGEHDDNA